MPLYRGLAGSPIARTPRFTILLKNLFRHFSYHSSLIYSLRHADGTGRTNEATEMTADTLCANESGLAGSLVKDNGLMTTVVTRYLTPSATDT